MIDGELGRLTVTWNVNQQNLIKRKKNKTELQNVEQFHLFCELVLLIKLAHHADFSLVNPNVIQNTQHWLNILPTK